MGLEKEGCVMIPIYRGKKLDSDEYVIGYLHKIIKNPNSYYGINKDKIRSDTSDKRFYLTVIDKSDIRIDGEFIEIDPSTLSIHFSDMLDSDGNKIFASLSEDGKGGDNLFYEDGLDEFVAEFTSNGFALYEYLDNKKIKNRVYQQNVKWHNLKVIGIQQ